MRDLENAVSAEPTARKHRRHYAMPGQEPPETAEELSTRLGQVIVQFWRRRGYHVEVETARFRTDRQPAFSIASDMVNGSPVLSNGHRIAGLLPLGDLESTKPEPD